MIANKAENKSSNCILKINVPKIPLKSSFQLKVSKSEILVAI